METESVSKVSGPHDMEAIEKKKIIISAYSYSYKIENALKYIKKLCLIHPVY